MYKNIVNFLSLIKSFRDKEKLLSPPIGDVPVATLVYRHAF